MSFSPCSEEDYGTFESFDECLDEYEDSNHHLRDSLYMIFCMGGAYLLPAMITLICFFIQASVLMNNIVTSSKVNIRITITILYLTTVFFICNICNIITWVLFEKFQIGFEQNRTNVNILTAYVTGVVLPFVNSLMNPLILIMRGKELQNFVKGTVLRKSDHTNLVDIHVNPMAVAKM